MKRYIKFILYTIITVFILGCEQEDVAPVALSNISLFDVKHNVGKQYFLEASVSDYMMGRISECGFYLSEDISMQKPHKVISKLAGNDFYAEINLPGFDTDYYVCAFISNGKNEMCSNMKQITIGALDEFVTFENPSMINYNSSGNRLSVTIPYAIVEGVIVDECGLYYSFNENVNISNPQNCLKGNGNIIGEINVEIPQVELGQNIYIIVYIKDGDHVAYSDKMILTSQEAPTVLTTKVKDITDISATIEYEISSDGGGEILSSGVVFGTMSEPTIDNASKAEGDNLGTVALKGLNPNTTYYVRAYATNQAGTSYGKTLSFQTEKAYATDLTGPANSYIVSGSGTYRYEAVKGNSLESVGEVSSVEVVWETFGTSVTPAVGDLIKSVEYFDGYVVFTTADTYREGNALIAVKNSDGTILWSWHIWMTDQPIDIYYRNVDTPMMDRNLGAVSATPGDVGALGLHYQWGRKDPFLGGATIGEDNIRASSTYTWPEVELSTQNRGTIEYATAHPTTFIAGNASTRDWYYPVDGVTDSTRWASEKSIYDPCPAGYRVPDGGENSVWTLAGFPEGSVVGSVEESVYTFDSTNYGMTFGEPYCSPATWYPATGCIYNGDGEIHYKGEESYSYAANYVPWGLLASSLVFKSNGYVGCQTYGIYCGTGASVRCIKELK